MPPVPPADLHTLQAPAAWRVIDLLSDVHLHPDMPRTFAAWRHHLLHTSADAVLLLGDLFEVWVGDDAAAAGFEADCAAVLREAAGLRALAFLPGNRDFLVGDGLLRATGVQRLADPTLLLACGHRLLLSHGDALCLADTEYQAFRVQVRGHAWQQDFLAKPLAERTALAAEMRRRSQQRRMGGTDPAADIDAATAVRWMHAMGTPELVHGHTHRPGSETLAPGYRRHVLSDWDLDDASARRAEALRLTRDGFRRIPVFG